MSKMTCCIVLDGGEKLFTPSYDDAMREISHKIVTIDKAGLPVEAGIVELQDILGGKLAFPLAKLNHFFEFDAAKAGDVKGEEAHKDDDPDIDYSTDQD